VIDSVLIFQLVTGAFVALFGTMQDYSGPNHAKFTQGKADKNTCKDARSREHLSFHTPAPVYNRPGEHYSFNFARIANCEA
jgi:hypothetical protein